MALASTIHRSNFVHRSVSREMMVNGWFVVLQSASSFLIVWQVHDGRPTLDIVRSLWSILVVDLPCSADLFAATLSFRRTTDI